MVIIQDLSRRERQRHVFSHGAKKCVDLKAPSDTYIFRYLNPPDPYIFSFNFNALALELRLNFIQ